ncbi:MAG: hypothetical protein K2H34_00385, partial [Lachnospiraceae bacterium]|nr:hypothetical protein [Lachnospiraceae bacterium]
MKKIFYYLMIGILVTGLLAGCEKSTKEEINEAPEPVSYTGLMKQWKQNAAADNLTCWYTSDTDRVLLETAAEAFKNEYGIRVNLVYYDGIKLFRDINQANQQGM